MEQQGSSDKPQKEEQEQEEEGGGSSSQEELKKITKPQQVKLQFLAVGGAPILKKTKFQVRDNMTISEILNFLRKTLKIRESDPIFVYINSCFAPGLDQDLRSLHQSFHVNDELVLQYAITNSYG